MSSADRSPGGESPQEPSKDRAGHEPGEGAYSKQELERKHDRFMAGAGVMHTLAVGLSVMGVCWVASLLVRALPRTDISATIALGLAGAALIGIVVVWRYAAERAANVKRLDARNRELELRLRTAQAELDGQQALARTLREEVDLLRTHRYT